MNLLLDRVASPIGTILLVSDDNFLRGLDFEDFEPRLHRLLRRHYGSYHLTPAPAAEPVRRAIAAYFDGDLTALDAIAVRTAGSDFQRRVWAELRRIPPGRPISYGRLATAIGRPTASRAVGMANGANPVALVVPCHRVIGADATLTGYGGGLHRKAWLLEHEARASPGPGGPLQ